VVQLADGSAIQHTATNGDTWLIEEILKHRGQAVIVAPGELRNKLHARALQLRELIARVPVA
jgi:predicted DNA-binding transcriptional regulator YafY